MVKDPCSAQPEKQTSTLLLKFIQCASAIFFPMCVVNVNPSRSAEMINQLCHERGAMTLWLARSERTKHHN